MRQTVLNNTLFFMIPVFKEVQPRYYIPKFTESGICPCCKKKRITIVRGIEGGNVFQLRTSIQNFWTCILQNHSFTENAAQ